MSNKSQDEPDEYEIIFDGANSGSRKEAVIEENDNDSLEVSEYADVAIDDSGVFDGKVAHNEGDDQDIEEGIFAPSRREKPEGRKNASLMWAVSLLAFVGVGAFVYVSNPDILSKVSNNIESGDGITLPNDMVLAETPEVAHEDSTVQPVDPNLQVPESASIKPDEVVAETQQETSHDLQQASSEMVNSPAAAPTSTETPAETPAVVATTEPVTPPPVVEQPVVVQPDVPAASVAVQPAPADGMTASAPVADVNPVIDGVGAIPSSDDVITPTNDKEDEVAAAANDLSQSNITPSTVVASPIAEGPPQITPSEPSKNSSVVEKDKTPVIVNSKEEQKALDDANLDKYFDSPDGKILRDIPAPSMNPNKGGNESIIVVNKKAQKTQKAKTDYSKPAGKIKIETTSLTTQMVSANRAMKLGRYEAAKEMYDELYRLNPRDGQILSGRAVLLQKMGFADQAITAYEELLKLYPDNTDAIVNLSGLIRKQYPVVALGKLLDLHMSHPNNVAVTAQLGVAYADSGNYADALRYLGDAATMDPKNALHFYNMAVISEKASKPDQAISYYEKALEIDAIYGEGYNTISKEKIYDRLAHIRGN